jgi:hypothetical protein
MEQSQQFWKMLLGSNHLVPLIDSPYAVFVDANCLAGEYVSDLATQFPNSRVYGIGRQHNLPANRPANCVFGVEDPVAGTSFASNSCHFVQSRDVSSSMRVENWKPYLQELYRILDSGGWIQVLECSVWRQYPDGEGGGYKSWSERIFPYLATVKGVAFSNLEHWLLQWAQEIGFIDIYPINIQIPVGDSDSRIRTILCYNSRLILQAPGHIAAGKLLRQNLLGVVESSRPLLSSIVMDLRETEILMACARGELYDDSFTARHNA